MVYNRQFMGWTGAAAAGTIVFPPQAVLRLTATGAVNNPESPTIIMRATPNPSEIWRIQAGTILRVFLFDALAQVSAGQVFIGKLLAGGLGSKYFHITNCNLIATPAASIDQNSALRMQQTMRIHPSETLIASLNDGGTAWAPANVNNEMSIPYEVSSGVSPSQMRASMARWG